MSTKQEVQNKFLLSSTSQYNLKNKKLLVI